MDVPWSKGRISCRGEALLRIGDSLSIHSRSVQLPEWAVDEILANRAEVERLRALLGEAASYDYGSSWSADLRRRIDEALSPKSCRYCGSTDLNPEDGNVCIKCDESPGAGVGPEDG